MLKLALALTFLCPVHAWAEDPISAPILTIPAGDDHIMSLEKGQTAPYAGHLFDTDTALRWANWLEQYKFRLGLDAGVERAKCKVELEYRTDVTSIERARTDTIQADLQTRLQRSEKRNIELSNEIMNRSFFSSMEFGLLLGVVATSGAVVTGALLAN